jgi:hypothetical protein
MNAESGNRMNMPTEANPDSLSIQHSVFSIQHFLLLDVDIFNFFRWLLAIIVTVYATVVTLQSLWGWYIWLAGSDRYVSLVRRYVVVHGLRLRFKAFWGDVVICVLLCFIFLIIWRAHQVIYDIGDDKQGNAPHAPRPVKHI